jgi:SAM-dependent methyltransferase
MLGGPARGAERNPLPGPERPRLADAASPFRAVAWGVLAVSPRCAAAPLRTIKAPSDREVLLAAIDRDVAPGVDWKSGARRYLAKYFAEWGVEVVERYAFTKPMSPLDPSDTAGNVLNEATWYLDNFVNLIRLLRLPAGSHVLDVACGGGWLSHYLSRFNYDTWGFDISPEFVSLARRRIANDNLVPPHRRARLGHRFIEHDIEAAPLPPDFGPEGGFDAVVLESCLHHFLDPTEALANLAAVLAPHGVVVVIEGENRQGPIKDEYRTVMEETHTLERPYERDHLVQAARLAGLPAIEFVGMASGWVRERDPRAQVWTQVPADVTRGLNMCVCAKDTATLARFFPYLTLNGSAP